MSNLFSVTMTSREDGAMVVAGGRMENLNHQLMVPSRMTRRVTYTEELPVLELDLVFSGDRLEIERMTAHAQVGYVSTQFLAHLVLPKVIRQVALESIPNSSLWLTDSSDAGLGFESYEYLAQLYWFEHLSWGAPRNAVMRYMGWSRANTNWHLRRMARLDLLPKRTDTEQKRVGKPPQQDAAHEGGS